jgi:mannose-1-phosphate guanylyltransferase/mannose-6-phosphate isomerase
VAASRGAARDFHAVLLAGGSGTRFWPLSRADRPKQFLALGGGRSLLVESWKRARRLAAPERVWVVAPRRLRERVRDELPRLRAANLILEPSPRDTGPAVTLVCATIARRDPRAVVGVFPTDHVIRDTAAFAAAVRVARRRAERDALVCLGVRPDRPATGFGYLRCSRRPTRGRAVAVERFVEKPDAATARRFLRSGAYLWNAGMFVWRAQRFLDEIERTEPAISRAVRAQLEGKGRAWARATRLSVDYAVMERARDVEVVPLDAGWDDVGSWDAAARLAGADGARERGVVRVDSPGSAVFGGRRMVALVDVPDVVVVDTEDALLVVARGRTEKVRRVVDELRRRGRRDLL